MSKNVAVLMGGWSNERDVSLSSGKECAKALREAGYNVIEVDAKRDILDLVAQLTPKPDVVFNALHGEGGEDGIVQSVLEIMQIPYTHSSPAASALAMDKQYSKEILRNVGVKVAEGYLVKLEDLRNGNAPLKPPFVIKPNCEGSSFGVYIIKDTNVNLRDALKDWSYCEEALVEQYIPGREFSVAVVGTLNENPRALTVTEIKTGLEFYNYEAKYSADGSEHIIPADVDEVIFKRAMEMAEIAHKNLRCSGVSRSDFRYNSEEEGIEGLYFLETNTQPGMTPTSLAPEQAAYDGMSFKELVTWLVENAANYT